MTKAKLAFAIVYRPETVRHLDAIQPKYLSIIRETIEEQLSLKPFNETTNRRERLGDSLRPAEPLAGILLFRSGRPSSRAR